MANDDSGKMFSTLCCSLLIFILLIILIFGYLIHFIEYETFIQHNCTIINIEKPLVLPSVNKDNWIKCDCGDDCISYKYCVKLYTEENPDIYMEDSFFDTNKFCTFEKSNCDKSPNYNEQLNIVNELYNEYRNRDNVTCFYNNDKFNIYLNKYFHYNQMIILCVFIIIFQICCIGCMLS